MKLLATLLIISFLLGCAAMKHGLGHDIYAQTPSKNSDTISTTYREAIDNSKAFPLVLNQTFHSAIQLNDALLKVGTDNLTYYKIFKISEIKDKKIEITVQSICSCFGFNKTVMPAKATILTESGEIIKENLKFEPQYPSYYEANFTKDNYPFDSAIILVAFNSGSKANSRTIDNITYTNSGALYLPMAINMKNTGEVLVEVNEVN